MLEETVPPALSIAMRALYQSSAGRFLLREGGIRKLRKMSGGRMGGPRRLHAVPPCMPDASIGGCTRRGSQPGCKPGRTRCVSVDQLSGRAAKQAQPAALLPCTIAPFQPAVLQASAVRDAPRPAVTLPTPPLPRASLPLCVVTAVTHAPALVCREVWRLR